MKKTKSTSKMMHALLLAMLVAILSPVMMRADVAFTPEAYRRFQQSKPNDRLSEARKKYPILVVDVLPIPNKRSFFEYYFNTDEVMIGFVEGKYAICSDTKKVFYMTPVMKEFIDGNVYKKVEEGVAFGAFVHYLRKFSKFYSDYIKILSSGGQTPNAMSEFAVAFKKGYIDMLREQFKNAPLYRSYLIELAEKSGMTKALEFAPIYNKLIELQHQRLSVPRPALPGDNASEEEILAYNQKAQEYVQRIKELNRAEMNKLIKDIETLYGVGVRDKVLKQLQQMRDNAR